MVFLYLPTRSSRPPATREKNLEVSYGSCAKRTELDVLLGEIAMRSHSDGTWSPIHRFESLPYLGDLPHVLFLCDKLRSQLQKRGLDGSQALRQSRVLLLVRLCVESSHARTLTSVAALTSPAVCQIARPSASVFIPDPACFCCLIQELGSAVNLTQ
jgi:hypothetical protein